MADEAAPRFDFFVYIIESPSAPDLYHGRSEGGRVAETLRLDGIPCVTCTAINKEAFMAALRLGLPEAMKQFSGRHPILHLSSHGSEDGIELSSGEMLSWADLRNLLIPVNQSLNGSLLLCMSACQGYSACRMPMLEGDDPYPYFVMIGSGEKPTWSDTAVAYLTFYHLLSKGRYIKDVVEAMGAASGVPWYCDTAEHHKQIYLDYVKNTSDPQTAQKELEIMAEIEPLSADAKSLERGSST
jgi:hypothetical protein